MRRLSPRISSNCFVLLKRRERTLAARSEGLEMLEVMEDRWFGRLMTPRRSSGCGACIPESTTRRHRGRLLCLGRRAKASTLHGRRRRFVGGSVFHTSFRGLLSFSVTQQKWYHHLHQVHNLIPHNYILVQHIRRCTQQTLCSTLSHPYCN